MIRRVPLPKLAPFNSANALQTRWPRFSLCTLLVAIGVVAVVLGIQTEQARRQQTAVYALRQLGAECTFDYELSIDGRPNELGFSRPSTIAEWLGVDWVHRVFWVDIGENADGVDTKALGKLQYLQWLTIYGQPDLDDAVLPKSLISTQG